MTLSYKDVVAIISIIIYIFALPLALFLTIRHGFGRSVGWIFMVIFALIRIIGSSIQLSVDHTTSPSSSPYETAAILSSVGLSPLLLATTGLLHRIDDACTRSFRTTSHIKHLLTLNTIPLTVGLVLSIVGGIKSDKSVATTGVFTPNNVFKAASVLFTLAFIATVILTALVARRRHGGWIDRAEELLLLAVGISLPLLAVRVIYTLLFTYDSQDSRFGLVGGNETVML